jgi:hypothetical protein
LKQKKTDTSFPTNRKPDKKLQQNHQAATDGLQSRYDRNAACTAGNIGVAIP